MTATANKTYDVFVSHAVADSEVARHIAAGLESAGLQTFYGEVLQPGTDIERAIWDALAECRALIAVVSPGTPMHAMGLVELGAALGWNKPVYVVVQDPSSMKLPPVLSGFPVYPLNRIDDVIYAIRSGFEPLTDSENGILAGIYEDIGVPADQLSQSPKALRDLSRKFNARTGKQLSGDRLLSEIFRMRKKGRLPRLRFRKARS